MIIVTFQTFVLTVVATLHLVNAHSKFSKSSRPSSTKWEPLKPSEVKKMYNNPFMSDVKFTFGNGKPTEKAEVFYAHKYVLSISSPVFYKMFYGETDTVAKTIHLSDHKRDALAGFLGFIYKDICPTDFEKDFEVLHLMVKYKIARFNSACLDSLHRNTEPHKAYKFLEKFLELNADGLVEMCLSVIDATPHKYFASEYFLNIEKDTLRILINRDTLRYNETAILKAVLKWADHRCSNQNLKSTRENRRMVLGNAIYSIRFLLMTQSEFTSHVVPTDILDNDETVAIIKVMNSEQVPNLVWDSVKLRSKRFQEHEWLNTSSVKHSSMAYYIGIFNHLFAWSWIYCLLFIMVVIYIVRSYFCSIHRGVRSFGNPGEGVKIQNSGRGQNTWGNPRKRYVKSWKFQGNSKGGW